MAVLLLMVVLLVTASTTASQLCPQRCICDVREIDCRVAGRADPPAGVWPDVKSLDLRNNDITALHPASFTGFPAVTWLSLVGNAITTLDFEPFAAMPYLWHLTLWGNAIAAVEQPPSGVRLSELHALDLSYNKLTSLDPDVLATVAPNLKHLYLTSNPFLVPYDGPVINHPTLQYLSLAKTNASGLSPQTFKGLPGMQVVHLTKTGIKNITGVFVNNPLLDYVTFVDCQITEVLPGTFPSGNSLSTLWLYNNPLTTLDVAAVASSVKTGGRLLIHGTPLVCNCRHEHIVRWAKEHKVHLDAACRGRPACSFPRH